MLSVKDLDFSILDKVLKKTITEVEKSKEQIFDISEGARREDYSIRLELENVRREVAEMIERTDALEKMYRQSRQRLVVVSRNFHQYTEKDIQEAYEKASQIQIDLSVSRDKEEFLRKYRNDLERRQRDLAITIEKANNMMGQIGVVLGYLTGDLGEFCAALETAQDRQMLGLQVIQGQEEERKRVAREIHDGPAQSMANIMIRTEIAEKMIDQGRIPEVKQELADLKNTVRNTLGEVRKIIFDLRPMTLDDLGLLPTLRKYMEHFQNHYQMEAELYTLGTCTVRLDPMVEVAMFRLIQEALSNAGKHSKSKNVKIKIEFMRDKITVVIQDEGIGFEHREKTDRPHFGIMGMKERIKLIQGTLTIDTAIGSGTKLLFTIPIKNSL